MANDYAKVTRPRLNEVAVTRNPNGVEFFWEETRGFNTQYKCDCDAPALARRLRDLADEICPGSKPLEAFQCVPSIN